jgi:hypothetical protein
MLAIQRGQDARGVRLLGAASQDPLVREGFDPDELRDWDASLGSARGRLGKRNSIGYGPRVWRWGVMR